ncbi:lipid II flippase MurJ [Actinomadura meridiana]|uniref:Lipid II flippase MurJ n=1 Tax=Actinomadura meridiana TaxID=559626 RepID=A0ABP8C7W3_9ACTN
MTSVGRAAALTGGLIAAGTALGFLRDLLMAHLFGASGSTDAFLVAWTIPETVSPLLIEDAMALLMVPVVTRLLARGDGLRPLVGATLPRMALGLAAVTLALVVAAPALVDVLAPGLTEPGPAVECVRLTAITVVTFGVAGFMSASLRAHHRFGPPAAIYVAYNMGILLLIAGLADVTGIMSAALGVACGGFLMIAVQAPAFVRCLRESPRPAVRDVSDVWVGVAAIAPIVVYTVTRQSQVFVERFFGSELAAGSISHLNYAQKVAQVPMVLSLMVVTVTFPRLARASADGDIGAVARRVQHDLAVASAMVLAATAFLVAFAPTVIRLLFEHGQFTSTDTGSTASIMRVYALGLWGQSAVGLAARAFFAQRRPTWRPAAVLCAGLAVTAVIGGLFAASGGTVALAAANAAGITLAAVLLLVGLRTGVAPVSLRRVGSDLARLVVAAAGAYGAGALTAALLGDGTPPVVELAVGGTVTGVAFAVLLVLAGPRPVTSWVASWIALGPLVRRGRTESGESIEPADGKMVSDRVAASGAGHPAGAAGADVPLGRSLR